MSRLPITSGKELISILSKVGFGIARIKGSHVIMRNTATPPLTVVVPLHKSIDKGTLMKIIKQSGLTKEEFLSLP